MLINVYWRQTTGPSAELRSRPTLNQQRRHPNIPVSSFVFAILTVSMCIPALASTSNNFKSSGADTEYDSHQPSHYFSSHVAESMRTPEFKGEDPSKVVRYYKLYNRCSGHYVQLYSDVVNARGKLHSPFVLLRVESDTFDSRIRIQSQKFGRYICFNRHGRLIARFNGASQRCVFTEKIAENFFTELQSVWNRQFYLGFNHKGLFLGYARYRSKRICFQFVKQETVDHVDQFNNIDLVNRPPVDLNQYNSSSNALLRQDKLVVTATKTLRHSHSHRRTVHLS